MPDFSLEQHLLSSQIHNNKLICGIDEVGRGSLAGPVVACALVLKQTSPTWLLEVNDSKLLSKNKRESLYNKIITNSFYALGSASALEIDSLNILAATKLAMQRAFITLSKECNVLAILVDGRDAIQINNNNIKVYPVIKGDQKSITIAAASIVAKVTRDNLMTELAKEQHNKVYLWGQNAGYGTLHHKNMITKHGITKHHRKSFAPIKNSHHFLAE